MNAVDVRPDPAAMWTAQVRKANESLRQIDRAATEFHLGATQVVALLIVTAPPMANGIAIGQIAAAIGITPQSATQVVDLLEGRGLIVRRDHPSDRRKWLLVATDAGRALRDPLIASLAKVA